MTISYGCMIEWSVMVVDTRQVAGKMKPGEHVGVEMIDAVLPHLPSHGRGLAPSRAVPLICPE